MSDDYAKSGQKACHTLMESAIKRLIRYKGKNINFNQVDKEYLIGFIDYLNHETNDFDTRSSDEKREKKPLSDVYKEALFARVMVALNKAEREGIIVKNPGKETQASRKGINPLLSHPRRGQENHRHTILAQERC